MALQCKKEGISAAPAGMVLRGARTGKFCLRDTVCIEGVTRKVSDDLFGKRAAAVGWDGS